MNHLNCPTYTVYYTTSVITNNTHYAHIHLKQMLIKHLNQPCDNTQWCTYRLLHSSYNDNMQCICMLTTNFSNLLCPNSIINQLYWLEY